MEQSTNSSIDSLLEYIKEEKQRLIKEKKIKKTKPLPKVEEDEFLFQIPKHWKWVRFEEITINRDGERVPVSQRDRENREKIYDYYGASGVIDKIDDYIFDQSLLLIGEDGANLLSRSKPIAFMAHGKYWVNNHAHAIDAVSIIILKYLEWYMNFIDLSPYVTGSAQPKLTQAKLNSIPVALPPLAEQVRIVNRIESLFDKVNKASELVDEARYGFEKRRAAILERAFSGELTRKWRGENGVEFNEDKISLSEVVNVNPKKPKLEVDDGQICSFIPMVAVSDVNGKIEAMEERPYAKVKKGYTYFEEGDVLFAKITPCMENGKSCIAEGLSKSFGFGTTEFHVLRCGEKVLNKYVYYLVRAKWFREDAKQYMTGAVGQQRVPKTYLEDYMVWVPSIEEQEEVVKLLEYMLDKEFEVEELCDIDYKVELLKKSILGRAFRGELGSNNLEEDSSINLLF